jgi:hypothetical protein
MWAPAPTTASHQYGAAVMVAKVLKGRKPAAIVPTDKVIEYLF